MDDQGQLPPDAKRLHEELINLIREAENVSRELRVGRELIVNGEKPPWGALLREPSSVAEVILEPQWPRLIRSLRKSVEAFSRHWSKAGAALYSLSVATLSRLDAMDAPGWRDRLRRTLDKLLEWPFLKKACQFDPPEVGLIVGVIEICDPPDWQDPLQNLAKTISDLYALRGPTSANENDPVSAMEVVERVPKDAPPRKRACVTAADTNANAGDRQAAGFSSNSDTSKKRERRTKPGGGRTKLIAALTKHHEYANGGCLNLEPIGNNQLARLAVVANSTAKDFFDKEFGGPDAKDGHAKYEIVCQNPGRLADSLKALNGEFSPHELYGRCPASEDDSRDEGDE